MHKSEIGILMSGMGIPARSKHMNIMNFDARLIIICFQIYLSYMTIAQSAKPYSSNITVTLKRLLSLLEEDEADDYGILQPSQTAYLYYELEDNYAVKRDVTASTLVHWLGSLNQG